MIPEREYGGKGRGRERGGGREREREFAQPLIPLYTPFDL